MNKFVIRNCPALRWDRKKFKVCYEGNKETKCCDVDDCIIKQIVGLCKNAKEKDPIVVERNNQTGEIISIGGWVENPIYDFAQKILQILEIEEVNE